MSMQTSPQRRLNAQNTGASPPRAEADALGINRTTKGTRRTT